MMDRCFRKIVLDSFENYLQSHSIMHLVCFPISLPIVFYHNAMRSRVRKQQFVKLKRDFQSASAEYCLNRNYKIIVFFDYLDIANNLHFVCGLFSGVWFFLGTIISSIFTFVFSFFVLSIAIVPGLFILFFAMYSYFMDFRTYSDLDVMIKDIKKRMN